MNANTTRTTRQPELPQLPLRQRLGSMIASVLVSTALLSSVVVGLTSAPERTSQLAAETAATTPG